LAEDGEITAHGDLADGRADINEISLVGRGGRRSSTVQVSDTEDVDAAALRLGQAGWAGEDVGLTLHGWDSGGDGGGGQDGGGDHGWELHIEGFGF